MKKWLRAQPAQPSTIAGLQALLDRFVDEYNHRRPHRSLPHRATLNDTYTTRPKATPTNRIILAHDLDIRIIDAATGELLRTLTLNPNIDYQPPGAPNGPTRPEK